MGMARLKLKMTKRRRFAVSFSGSLKASKQFTLQKKYVRPSIVSLSPWASSTYMPQMGSFATGSSGNDQNTAAGLKGGLPLHARPSWA